MKFALKSAFRPLALAVGLLSATAYADDTPQFSQVIIFGDSLSDTGRIKATVGEVAPPLANALQPSFTTNPDPVWATILAGFYGKTAKPFTKADPSGTNFAVGGARSGEEVSWNGVITVPSTATQIKEYLTATGGKTDPNALYAVWIGSNDLIAAANATTTADAQKAITNSVTRTVTDIATLDKLGAKYILVPNIPDLSLTPRAIFGESLQAGTQAKAKLAATLYNQGLYTALNGVNANIIPANTFALLQEATTNKEAFGFKNVNGVACQMPPRTTGADDPASTSLGCTSANLIEPDAGETYAFADDIHPSGKTHRILAQYYRSLIDSPAQIAQVSGQLAKVGAVNHDKLHKNVANLSKTRQSFWVDLSGTKDSNKPNLMAGVNIGNQNSDTGVYFNVSNNEKSVNTHLTSELKEVGFGVYHTHTLGKVQVGVDVGVDKLDVATDRTLNWEGATRTHTGAANGTRYHAGLTAGLGVQLGKATLMPYVGVNAQKIQLDTISENNASQSTALQVTLPNQTHTHAKVGVDVSIPMSDKVSVNAGLSHQRAVGGDDEVVVASKLSSISEYNNAYKLTTKLADSDTTNAHLGVKVALAKADVGVGVTANRDDNDTDVGGYVGVQMKF